MRTSVARISEYEKRHTCPVQETGYEIGTVVGLFSGPAAQWGVEICKDMDFPGLVARLWPARRAHPGGAGVGLH